MTHFGHHPDDLLFFGKGGGCAQIASDTKYIKIRPYLTCFLKNIEFQPNFSTPLGRLPYSAVTNLFENILGWEMWSSSGEFQKVNMHGPTPGGPGPLRTS